MSTLSTKVYNPANTICLLAGVPPIDWADGTYYSISMENDLISPYHGTDGRTALAINLTRAGTLTISLKQISETNKTLAAFASSLLAGTGTPFFTVFLKEPSSGLTINTMGWIQTQPDYEMGREINQLDWVIGLADATLSPVAGVDTGVEAIAAATE